MLITKYRAEIKNTKYKYTKIQKNSQKIQNVQFYNGGPLLEMPMSGLVIHTLWNATSASWIFFNREALG